MREWYCRTHDFKHWSWHRSGCVAPGFRPFLSRRSCSRRERGGLWAWLEHRAMDCLSAQGIDSHRFRAKPGYDCCRAPASVGPPTGMKQSAAKTTPGFARAGGRGGHVSCLMHLSRQSCERGMITLHVTFEHSAFQHFSFSPKPLQPPPRRHNRPQTQPFLALPPRRRQRLRSPKSNAFRRIIPVRNVNLQTPSISPKILLTICHLPSHLQGTPDAYGS